MKTPTFTPNRSEAIKAQLLELSRDESLLVPAVDAQKRSWKRPAFALAATGAIMAAASGLHMNALHAHATETLNDLSHVAINYQDPQPGAGEYLKVTVRGFWANCDGDDTKDPNCQPGAERIATTYRPADADAVWVHEAKDLGSPERDQVVHAPDGNFFGPDPYRIDEMLAHATSGEALYTYVNDTYAKGSASRAEDNFVRLTAALESGFIPAKQRAIFYSALTRVSGVSVTEDVTTADGRVGVAIGRTEPLRLAERSEIIIDPQTGQLISTRTIATMAVLGYGKNEVTGQSVVDYAVVTDAPPATTTP